MDSPEMRASEDVCVLGAFVQCSVEGYSLP
jgi:hypothetical protein